MIPAVFEVVLVKSYVLKSFQCMKYSLNNKCKLGNCLVFYSIISH